MDREELRCLDIKREEEMQKYLRRTGWEYTCSTPGSYWMWEKELDGRVLLVGEPTAFRIQGVIEELATLDKEVADEREAIAHTKEEARDAAEATDNPGL